MFWFHSPPTGRLKDVNPLNFWLQYDRPAAYLSAAIRWLIHGNFQIKPTKYFPTGEKSRRKS